MAGSDRTARRRTTLSWPFLIDVYAGQALRGESRYTRLVHLLPGGDEDSIRCTLRITCLDDPEGYEALSYVWGDSTAKKAIFVNGRLFPVTENLRDVLRNLRQPHRERVLWIDAICINQADIVERNAQVKRMDSIYKRARRVLVWLGLETPESKEAFSFLARAYRTSKSPTHRDSLLEDPGWDAMKDLYKRQYWRRVWIVQEVCLATEAVIVCGRTTIPWVYVSELRKTRNHIWTRYLSKGEINFRRSLIARVDAIRFRAKDNNCDLWTLLQSFSGSDCHEIHDKIYGFIGVASDCREDDLEVDYAKPLSQLYEDVVRLQYERFRKDKSSPHSAQIMKFSEFLQNYLQGHPKFEAGLHTMHQTQTRAMSLFPLRISGAAAMVVDGAPTEDQAEELRASDLVRYLAGAISYSQLSFWREKIDSSLTTVYEVKSSETYATVDSQIKSRIDQDLVEWAKPVAVVATYMQACGWNKGAAPTFQTIVIAPPGTRVGDIICTFVDSEVALVMRKSENDTATYKLIGRAQPDFQHLEANAALKHRLAKDHIIELTSSQEEINLIWPVTLNTSMSTLQTITKATVKQRTQSDGERQLELMPKLREQDEVSTSKRKWRLMDIDRQRALQQDVRYSQFLRAPAVGIQNLGSTGYLSCVIQLLYHLKPLREAILHASFHRDTERTAFVLQQLFHKLQKSDLPVSPSTLVEAFGWEERMVDEAHDFFEVWRVLTERLAMLPAFTDVAERYLRGQYSMRVVKHQGTTTEDSERKEWFYDYCFDATNGTFAEGMRSACMKDSDTTLTDGYHITKAMEFCQLPPILVVEARFIHYSFQSGMMETFPGSFEYPEAFDFADVANVRNNDGGQDTMYQLHGVVMHEDLKPSRYMIYLRPSEDDTWMLFFNETVTFALHREVFHDNFERGNRADCSASRLRSPTVLIFLKKSLLGELLY